MKRSTIITIIAFAVGIIVLTLGFVLLTDNNLFPKETTTESTTTTTGSESTEPEYEPMDFSTVDVSKYVTLGAYKGLTVNVDVTEAPEREVELYIALQLFDEKKFTKREEGTVAECDIFNFDYSGWYYIIDADGEKTKYKFDGGTAQGSNAYINDGDFCVITESGVSTFIEGFAEGMLGAKVGEEFDIAATFPETYTASPELAGMKVNFTVKVNYIAEPETTDENISEYTNGDYTTFEAYRAFVSEYLTYSIQQNNITSLWTEVRNNATFSELPEQEVEYWYNAFKDEIEYYVYMYSLYGYSYTYETLLAELGFENDDALKEYAESIVKDELVTYAVIQTEGIEINDEEYEYYLNVKAKFSGSSREDILKNYTEEQLREEFAVDKAGDLLLSENTLVVK